MKDQYKNVSKGYDRIIEPMVRNLKIMGLEMSPVSKNTSVLDIGCGTGSLLKIYQKYTENISGIDVSLSMIRVARKKLNEKANLIVGSATKTEFKPHSFDLITCSLILHEVSDVIRIEILKEATRILQNNGRILLIDYHPGPIENFEGVYSKIVIRFFEFLAGGDHHKNYRHFIKNGGLPRVIEKAGLKIEKERITGGGNFGIFVLRK
ncbi:methyltransferase domain-containing protein [Desulforhopalus vacuolatus]|uniref:class I SAM-dependent methyltransferase n=1 Tax=Desulforhopalus vacuolatus TaxID=40414 RepID=UPI001962BA4E|nr:methyltransferase domain-containing protein [Desulforhopalus vacuolatus]MBM9519597.1 methyltransferase domain-containing protein [Desulforhopalus vacuolatus]